MAEEDKNQILALFQAATGIDNLELAFSSLEDVDWNLAKALEIFAPSSPVHVPSMSTPPEPPLPFTIPTGPTQDPTPLPSQASDLYYSYPLSVRVRYEDTYHTINVYSSKTIADFKTEVCVKLNIPSTHLNLSGWPRIVNDEMTLGDCCPGVLANTLSLKAERRVDENRVVCIQLTYPPADVKEFVFPVKNTIMELKQHVAQLSGIPVKDQAWSGLPIGATDLTIIRNSNFKNPLHSLAVTKKNNLFTDRSVTSTNNHNSVETEALTKQESQDDGEMYYDCSDSEPDIDLIEDDLDDTPSDNFKDPMIPENCIDQSGALAIFSENFEKRYGPIHPIFFCGSMKDVIAQATKGDLLDRRPVAVYLHHDRSISSNIFCQRILCSEIISGFLSSNYLTWAWDMTLPTNTTRFLDNVTLNFGDEIRKHLGALGPSSYPLLLIFQKKTGQPLEIATMLSIDTPHDEALSMLVAGYEQHVSTIEELRDVEEARFKRELIKQEQDEAYKESAERDERNMNQKKAAQLKRIVSQEARLRAMAMKEDSINIAKQELPEEPEKSNEVTSIRFRFPSGEVTNRRFFKEDKIGLLYTYIHSKGCLPELHRLMMNFPKKYLSDCPSNATLAECGLCPQAIIFVEECFDDS
ncbi:FAS-associated factor 1-like [Oopsacas minuta]|uniref:FAS-associated factor 1-like n=1 Tax=Oopsacas minuta TaxID=111878 RepID=A0AAV7JEE1_9METZ|nr:FAS-associated factor 1-like [Oopsacas minuta]